MSNSVSTDIGNVRSLSDHISSTASNYIYTVQNNINSLVSKYTQGTPSTDQLDAFIDSLAVIDVPYPVDFTFSLEDIGLGSYVAPEYAVGTISPYTAPTVPTYKPPTGTEPTADKPDAVTGSVDTSDQMDAAYTPDGLGELTSRDITAPTIRPVDINPQFGLEEYREFDVGTVTIGDAPTFSGTIKDPSAITIATPGTVAGPTKSKDFSLKRPEEISTLQPDSVYRPAIGTVTPDDIGDRPEWDMISPTFDFDGEPGESPDNWVGTAPSIGEFRVAAYSGPADPPSPTLLPIPDVSVRDPSIPEISLSDFPTIGTLPSLDGTLYYVDPGYEDAQLLLIKSEVSRVINGGLGIPDYFWEQIWDKATAQLHRQAVALERQARRTWAKLGWSMPGGTALAGREQAAHDINEQVSAKALEISIQRTVQEREDFWKAIQEGTALQQLLIGLYNSQQERALKLAISQVEVYVNVYNAYVAKFSAEVQAVQYKVAVSELQLKAALAILDVDKAKLEAAKLKGEINQIAVQTYVAQWEAVKNALAKWEIAVKTTDYQVKQKELEIQRYAEQTKNWMTEVEAWGKEWEGYVAKLKAQETKANVYEASARVFSERMKGYGISAEAEKSRVEAAISGESLKLEQYKTDLQKYQTDWQAINAKLTNATQVYSIDAQIYGTQADLAKAVSQIDLEEEKLKLQKSELDVQYYKAQWDGQTAKLAAMAQAYTASIQGYSAKINGEVQALQANIAAKGLSIQAFSADVEKYKADVETALGEIEASVKYFTADVQYKGVEAQLIGSRLQADAALIGHQVQLEGYKVQYLGARAQYLANLVSAQVGYYSAKVEKFAAEVQFEKAEADIWQAKVASAKGVLDGEVAAFQAAIQGHLAQIQTESEVIQAETQRLQAEASAATAAYQIGSLGSDIYTRAGQVNAQVATANAQISSSAILGIAEVKAKGYEALAGFESQLAAGAMAAMNITASISTQASGNASVNASLAQGNSYSESVSADGGNEGITGPF